MPEDDLKVVEAVEKVKSGPDNLIELSTGVVLKGKKANPVLLLEVMADFPHPKPPVQFMEKMGRYIENAADPDYLDRVKAWQAENSNKVLTALILLGTELESKPKKMPGPDDDAWLEEYELLNITMHPENQRWRYLVWVKSQACADENDLMKIQEVVGRLSGVSERAVQAAEAFPGRDQKGG